MSAPITITRAWNHASEVRVCATCEGLGVIHDSTVRPSTWNPYPQRDCPDCDGEHEPCCLVCGFGQVVAGYDCAACDTIASLTDKDFAKLNDAALSAAIMRAAAMRRRAA